MSLIKIKKTDSDFDKFSKKLLESKSDEK